MRRLTRSNVRIADSILRSYEAQTKAIESNQIVFNVFLARIDAHHSEGSPEQTTHPVDCGPRHERTIGVHGQT